MCVLGLEPGIIPSRLPAGRLPQPWHAVMTLKQISLRPSAYLSFSLVLGDSVGESDLGIEVTDPGVALKEALKDLQSLQGGRDRKCECDRC